MKTRSRAKSLENLKDFDNTAVVNFSEQNVEETTIDSTISQKSASKSVKRSSSKPSMSKSASRSSEHLTDITTDTETEELEIPTKNGFPYCSKLCPIRLLKPRTREKRVKALFDKEEYEKIQKLNADEDSDNKRIKNYLMEAKGQKGGELTTSLLDSMSLSFSQYLRFDKSVIEGWGVRTTVPIPKGSLVIEYIGEIIRPIIADKRQEYYEKHGNNGTYVFKFNNDEFLDATNRGGLARFINHSCDPNCKSTITKVNGRYAVILTAIKNIKQYEELTYDYNLPFEPKSKAIECYCGSANCRKYLNYKEGLYDDDTMKKLVLPNIDEASLEKLIIKGILPPSLFQADAEYYKKHCGAV